MPKVTQQRRKICSPAHPCPKPTLSLGLPPAQPNPGPRGAETVNSPEPPIAKPPFPMPMRETKSRQRQKEMCRSLVLKVFYQGGFQGKRAALERETGEDTTGPFWGGGSWNRPPTAYQEGPTWAKDYRGPTALPQTSPPFSPSPSLLAIDRVCDMVDQYGRDIKPAGCLPASASLSLARLPCFPFPEPHPDPPPPWTPYPRLWGARSPTRCQHPTAGGGEPVQPGEGVSMGVGRAADGDGGPTGRSGGWERWRDRAPGIKQVPAQLGAVQADGTL